MEICSPVASSISISRLDGLFVISCALAMRSSVVIALRRDHDDDVVARVAGVGHNAGHVEDAAAVLDRSTAEFLYDQCHWLLSSPLPHS